MREPDSEIILRGQASTVFLKKQPFTGSWKGMRYRLWKNEDVLQAAIYPGPYCWEATEEEKKEYKEFEFTEDGFDEAVAWLNERYQSGEWPAKN